MCAVCLSASRTCKRVAADDRSSANFPSKRANRLLLLSLLSILSHCSRTAEEEKKSEFILIWIHVRDLMMEDKNDGREIWKEDVSVRIISADAGSAKPRNRFEWEDRPGPSLFSIRNPLSSSTLHSLFLSLLPRRSPATCRRPSGGRTQQRLTTGP